MKNFGDIKAFYNDILVESIITKNADKKKQFSNYMKMIKEDEILKTQFLVYHNIENKIEENEFKASQFVKEMVSLFDRYTKEEIKDANDKLSVGELSEENTVDSSVKKLHEDINALIMTKKGPNTIDRLVEATSRVVKFIGDNQPNEINESLGMSNSILSKLAVEKYNQEYSGLNETEKEIVKTVINDNEDDKKSLYENTIRECITLVDENLKECNLDVKEKLLQTKDNLLRREYNKDSFVSDISKVIELKENLK